MRSVLLLLVLASILPAQEVAVSTPRPIEATKLAPAPVHELVLSGVYADLPSLDLGIMALAGGGDLPKAFYPLIESLEELAEQGAGTELLVDLSSLAIGLDSNHLQELSRAFQKLRAAGVKTTAYLENAGTTHYLLAAECDRVLLADMAMLDFGGPRLSTMHFKDALDHLGIEMQVTRVGAFKGAAEPFVLSRMSDHLREHYRTMLGTMNDDVIGRIAARRNLSPETLRAAQARRLHGASDAAKHGLVDAVVPYRGARSAYAMGRDITFKTLATEKKPKKLNMMSLLTGSFSQRKARIKERSNVVLHLSGAIMDGAKKMPGVIVSGPTVQLIKELQEDEKVAGVVVRINSPGGSATASEAILLALRELAAKKPVSVSMGSVAASGGYYVAAIGAPIVAEPTTITGSIGVFGMRPNLAKLSKRIGVHHEVVALDEDAARLDDLFQPLDQTGLDRIQAMVDDIYVRFQDRILEVRPMSRENLEQLAGGRVWSGVQARGAGLVDQLGGLEVAISNLPEKGLPVVHRPEARTDPMAILEDLLGGLNIAAPELKALARRFELDGLLAILHTIAEQGARPQVWALMPFELKLR